MLGCGRMVFKIEFEEEDRPIADGDDVYSEKFRNRMVEDDELTPVESAFMEGWEKAE